MEAVDLDLKGNDGREIFGPSRRASQRLTGFVRNSTTQKHVLEESTHAKS